MGIIDKIITLIVGGTLAVGVPIETHKPEKELTIYTVASDKTAQWTAQEKSCNYSMRVHGWEGWENAAYIGFTLPRYYTADGLVSAKLILFTDYYKNSSEAFLYTAQYDSFDNLAQYEGKSQTPPYSSAQIRQFTAPENTGDFDIDITDYMKSLSDNTANAAFRIDVKSQNTDNSWCIAAADMGMLPRIELTYDSALLKSTNVTVNITHNGKTLKKYTDTVLKSDTYTLTGEQRQYIRKNDDIYYMPENASAVFPIPRSDSVTLNVEFDKITVPELVDCGSPIAKAVTSDSFSDWRLENNAYTGENPHYAFIETDENSSASKIFTGLENGIYSLYADCRRTTLDFSGTISAKTADNPIYSSSAGGNGQWRSAVIQGINVTDNKCEITLSGSAQFANIRLEKVQSSPEFLTGGDITELSYVENCGGVYRDENGIEKDALQIMSENGCNFARIRIYNNPGKGRGNGSHYLPDGFQNVQSGLELAKRAKNKGMKIQLTLYYSDFWADGANQIIPYDWQNRINGMTDEEAVAALETLIYEFTEDTMRKMKAQNTVPEYVSIGNEIQNGILFPYGSTDNPQVLARFLNSASKAIRKTVPESKIVIHLDGTLTQYYSFFDNCRDNNVDYDVIGPSYYPFWSKNTVDEIVSFYNTLIDRYDKDILVMETGYNFTPLRADGYIGQLADNGPYDHIYPSSPHGQRGFLDELFGGLKSINGGRCVGALYWNPIMVNQSGVGWAINEYNDKADVNVISNTTLFSFNKVALPAFDSFAGNGYLKNALGIGGKITKSDNTPLAESEITFSVNGTPYTAHTDKYGEYFIYTPYSTQIDISLCDTNSEVYSIDMSRDRIKTNINFKTDK